MATVKKFTELEIWRLGNALEKKIYTQLNNGSLSKEFFLRHSSERSRTIEHE